MIGPYLDVLRNTGVSPNTVLVHQSNQFTLLEVVRWLGVLRVSVETMNWDLHPLIHLPGVHVDLIQGQAPLLPGHGEEEASVHHLVPGVAEGVAIEVDIELPLQVLAIIMQGGNEVSGDILVDLPLIALADLTNQRTV